MVIYFGYTYCPPTDYIVNLASPQSARAGREAVQPIFISVDPQRDTVAHLADYVMAFHPRLLGLTGYSRSYPGDRNGL